MSAETKIAAVEVVGLQGVFNYKVEFPKGSDTVILIAPNGYGKTALLSLIKDCFSINLRRIASHEFTEATLTFQDNTKWKFTKDYEGEREKFVEVQRRMEMVMRRGTQWAHHYGESLRSVTLKRYDEAGNEIQEEIPDFSGINPRVLGRALERISYLSQIGPNRIRDLRFEEVMSLEEAVRKFYPEMKANPQIREMLAASSPSAVWANIQEVNCVFIETQRLLYSKVTSKDENEKSVPEEEIVRQAHALSTLLNQNYSDYATRSQGLDRSFPNRLIARARSGATTNTDRLRKELKSVERARAALTEAGILVEQADNIIATDDELLPKVVDALQIYVEDSQDKLSTYDEIFPKISVFRELMSKKLEPKRLTIGKEFGATVHRGTVKLDLKGLSSGEKHEFIMLYKLIFETPSESIVLIDEPEISLHVVWQLEFMSDLRRIQSANPFQSIIATHSPQIFQGCKHLLVDLADQVG